MPANETFAALLASALAPAPTADISAVEAHIAERGACTLRTAARLAGLNLRVASDALSASTVLSYSPSNDTVLAA